MGAKVVPQTREDALSYWARLRELRNMSRVGDTYLVADEGIVTVTAVHNHYVVTEDYIGRRECFLYDDLIKMMDGTFKREGNNRI